jgi:hypothetical protein
MDMMPEKRGWMRGDGGRRASRREVERAAAGSLGGWHVVERGCTSDMEVKRLSWPTAGAQDKEMV